MKLFGFSYHNDESPWEDAPAWAIEVREMLAYNNDLMENIMATLDQVLADVTNETTQLDGIATLIQGLQDQVKAVPSLTPDQQAAIDKIFAAAETNKQKIATALASNAPAPTPAAGGAPPAGGTATQPKLPGQP